MTAILKFNDGGEQRRRLEALIQELAVSPEQRDALRQILLGEAACRQLGLMPVPEGFKLSVVIPVYNERQWVRELVRRVQAVPIPKEIILVDDCSTDGTREIIEELAEIMDNLHVVLRECNGCKGAALRDGFQRARGD